MDKFIVILIGISVLLSACQLTLEGQQAKNTIAVSGSANILSQPDEAVVVIRVETKAQTTKEAQDNNSRLGSSVVDALKDAGIPEGGISTVYYNVYRESYYDSDLQRYVEGDYVATHSLQVKTGNLEIAGDIVQKAVGAGATNIESVSFGLSDRKQRETKQEALGQAARDARDKADAIASGLGLKVGKVSKVEIQDYIFLPYRAVAAEVKVGAPTPPPITPGDVSVSASVLVTFEIG